MARRKLEDSQIKIPQPLIFEVDKIVEETGLYSDEVEFVADAVRRLIIESKKEVNMIPQKSNFDTRSRMKMDDLGSKRTVDRPPQIKDG